MVRERASSFLNLRKSKHEQIQSQNVNAFLHSLVSNNKKTSYGFCQCGGITHCLSHKCSYQSLSNRSFFEVSTAKSPIAISKKDCFMSTIEAILVGSQLTLARSGVELRASKFEYDIVLCSREKSLCDETNLLT